MPFRDKVILIGTNLSIEDNEGTLLYNSFVKSLIAKNIKQHCQIKQIDIFGLSTYKTIVKVFPENIVYVGVSIEDVNEIIESHIINGKPLERLLYKDNNLPYIQLGNIPFYHKQYRIVLRNCGIVNPESITDYLERDGYKGLVRALSDLSRDEVINEMKIANLRGRGGAGFPTWMKWNFGKAENQETKFVICNADEGDPGAYMDRSVLEGDPHSILEGMTIAAYAIGASQGFIYCRAEYPLAIDRLEKAIASANEYGLLGDNILGTDFSFNIEVRLGAGAFVCGEETALIASIEGDRGVPRPRPPYPTVKGLWNNCTVINNVETLANVPVILLKGGEWFSKIGTEKSKGTKVFALTGKVKKSGLVEVPMGTTLREIIYDIGEGIINDAEFKAAQTGGPSGGVIPVEYIDTPINYEKLQELGSIMGSGGLIIMDNHDCMVDVAKFYLQFSVEESCGKCAPCRIGGKQLLLELEDISKGVSRTGNTMELIQTLSKTIQNSSLCGLGQTTPNPVLSTMKYFEEEYKKHIEEHHCPAGVCKELIVYSIIDEKCIGCAACVRKCPVGCITGQKKMPHVINKEACIKCGECFSVCKFNAISMS